eukprot:CAMPEP_0173241734 /NCGR_PEP_ID=MMETSP1142-20121109/14540_1 /TAXON_ID=483371 /ORGANISM="non described non described, Strain CCMP2298" /LENGTH=57 /DNA_ID=CAMNT_0014173107 /DNA_START=298 /DNA_END=467 /DNA_ORIENTATION=-
MRFFGSWSSLISLSSSLSRLEEDLKLARSCCVLSSSAAAVALWSSSTAWKKLDIAAS